MRGATDSSEIYNRFPVISIHAPHAGSDQGYSQGHQMPRNFNPRSPCGERHEVDQNKVEEIKISIHAPHAGSDVAPRY